MRLDFDDGGYIELVLSKKPGKVFLTIAAKDYDNPLKKIINSAELTLKELSTLVYGLGVELPKEIKKEKIEQPDESRS